MRRIHHELTDSTNLEARRAFAGEPLVIVAAQQSAGMGRLGRTWLSPRGGLWLTFVWPLRSALTAYQAIPLAVGLAAAEAVEAVCPLEPRLKWPNDVFIGERKLAGILCQSELDIKALVAGIGINANFPAASLGDGLRHVPTSLLDELGHELELEKLEDALVSRLTALFEAYERGEFKTAILPGIRQRLHWMGERVASTGGHGEVFAEGVIEGVDDGGALLLRTDAGVKPLTVGELHRLD